MKPRHRFAIEYEIPGRGRFILAAGSPRGLRAAARHLGLSEPAPVNVVPVSIAPRKILDKPSSNTTIRHAP